MKYGSLSVITTIQACKIKKAHTPNIMLPVNTKRESDTHKESPVALGQASMSFPGNATDRNMKCLSIYKIPKHSAKTAH